MKTTQLLLLFSLFFGLTSNKEAQRDLAPDIKGSNLVFIGDIDTVVRGKVYFTVSDPVFSKRKNYVLNCRNMASSYRRPGYNGIYLVLAKRDHKHISTRAVFKVVNNNILISDPYLNLLLDAGWAAKVEMKTEFREGLVGASNSSNYFGVEVSLDTMVKLIKEIKGSKDPSGLKDKYPEGSFERALIKGISD